MGVLSFVCVPGEDSTCRNDTHNPTCLYVVLYLLILISIFEIDRNQPLDPIVIRYIHLVVSYCFIMSNTEFTL